MKQLLVLGLIFLGLSSAASATIIEVNISGTVSDGGVGAGHDFTGVFGAPGSLVGENFVADFLFDTSKGTRFTGVGLYQTIGGAYNGTTSPSLGATLTINGHTVAFSGLQQGWASLAAFQNQATFSVHDLVNNGGFQDFGTMSINLSSSSLPNSLDVPFTALAGPGDFINLFTVWNGFGSPQNLANGVLDPTSVTVTLANTAPTPIGEPPNLTVVVTAILFMACMRLINAKVRA